MDIEKLYRLYGPMVLRRCRRLLRNEDEALDALQDVFLRLTENGGRLNEKYPSSLLYRMATNLCLNRIRDRGGRFRNEEPLDRVQDQLVDKIARHKEVEARSMLDILFRKNKEGTRMMAMLHFVDGMTLEETAREVGLSVSGVRKRLSALRLTLQELEGS